MPRATAERENYTPSTTNSDIAVTATTTSVDVIMEAMCTGTAAASAINRQGLVRHTVNGVTPAAVTLVKMNPQSQAIAAAAATTFTTPPTFASQNGLDLGINAFGGVKRWAVFDLREGFWLIGAGGAGSQEGSLTAKNGAGGGTQNAHLVFEEL